MTEPIPFVEINDKMILAGLDSISTPASAEKIQAAAYLSMVAAYDHKIKREPFLGMMGHVTMLHDTLARLHMANAMLVRMQNNNLSPETLQDAIKDLTQRAEADRVKLLENMKLVAQCPDPEDSKH